jgi:TRAP-type mannitol/chloroaromatic compound transport system substrate-binding protein
MTDGRGELYNKLIINIVDVTSTSNYYYIGKVCNFGAARCVLQILSIKMKQII